MTEERTLVANLVPKVQDSDLADFRERLGRILSTDLNIDVNSSAPETVNAIEEVRESIAESVDASHELNESLIELTRANEEANGPNETNVPQGPSNGGFLGSFKDAFKDAFGDLKGSLGGITEAIGAIGNIAGTAGMAIVGAVRLGFGMIEKVINYLKGRSPVLRTVLEMLENVLNILLAPMFTAIGIELIPLLQKVYDKVMGAVQTIWDAYEEGGLAGIIGETINQVFSVLLDTEIWQTLMDTAEKIISGVLNGIGKAVFGEENWDMISDLFFNVDSISKFVSDIAHFFGYGADKKTDEELATSILTSMNSPLEKIWNWADYVEMAKRVFGLSEGGVVEPSPLGTFAVLGEGGEREFVIPESKVGSFIESNTTSISSGTTVYNITINGYTDTDLSEKIMSVVNRNTDMYRLRGGF